MKRILVLILLTLIGTVAIYGQTQNVSQLVTNLQDPDWTVRADAFYSLSKVGFSTSDQLKLALMALLTTENANNNPAVSVLSHDGTEDYGEYYGDVIAAVAALNDSRSISSLVGAINTGSIAMSAVASFGTNALSQVIQQLSNASDPTMRMSAAVTIRMMINANLVSDSNSQSMIQTALTTAFSDPDYFVRLSVTQTLTTSLNKVTSIRVPQSGTTCNGTYNGSFVGNLTISSGQTCIFVGGSITGDIAETGGNLGLLGTAVRGNVDVHDQGTLLLSNSTNVQGNLQIHNLRPSSFLNQVCAATVNGNVSYQNNGAAVTFGGGAICPANTVGRNLQIQNNSAALAVTGNTVNGNLQVQNDSADAQINGNTVSGNLQVQRNTASSTVSNNNVGGNLQCDGNTVITGSGNTAKQKQGQSGPF